MLIAGNSINNMKDETHPYFTRGETKFPRQKTLSEEILEAETKGKNLSDKVAKPKRKKKFQYK